MSMGISSAQIVKDKSGSGSGAPTDAEYYVSTKHASLSAEKLHKSIDKTADETINSSTTLQDDDELTVAVEANKRYRVLCMIRLTSDPAPDFKYAFTVPTDAICVAISGIGSSTGLSNENDLTASQTITTVNTNTRYLLIVGTLLVRGNAGSITLQWAQNTSDAANTTVNEGSWLAVIES